MPAPDQTITGPASFFRRQQDEDAAESRAAIERANALGLWALADVHMPPDIAEAARRWKLDQTLPEMWRSAFMAGFRAAEAARPASPDVGGTAE
jgi:hypothetical protein